MARQKRKLNAEDEDVNSQALPKSPRSSQSENDEKTLIEDMASVPSPEKAQADLHETRQFPTRLCDEFFEVDRGDKDSFEQKSSVVRIKSLSARVATVLVGPTETKFVIHEALLCHFSKFFFAAFRGSGHYEEQSSLTVQLPEADSGIFDLFVQWIYGVHGTQWNKTLTYQIGPQSQTLTILASAKLFHLGSFLQCDLLTDSLSSAARRAKEIWREGSRIVDLKTVQYVYENFEDGSEFRGAVVEIFSADSINFYGDPDEEDEYPKAFLWDLAMDLHCERQDKDREIGTLQFELRNVHKKPKRN